jgi:hypothetical protein
MRRNRIVSALFYLVLGGGFVGAGLLHPEIQFIAFQGAVFVFFGLYTLMQLLKLTRTVRDVPKT